MSVDNIMALSKFITLCMRILNFAVITVASKKITVTNEIKQL